MEDLVKKLEEEEIRDEVKVVVGGATTSDLFAGKIGADAYYEDIFEVNDVMKSLKSSTGFANVLLQGECWEDLGALYPMDRAGCRRLDPNSKKISGYI